MSYYLRFNYPLRMSIDEIAAHFVLLLHEDAYPYSERLIRDYYSMAEPLWNMCDNYGSHSDSFRKKMSFCFIRLETSFYEYIQKASNLIQMVLFVPHSLEAEEELKKALMMLYSEYKGGFSYCKKEINKLLEYEL